MGACVAAELARCVVEQGFTLQRAAARCNVSAKTTAKWVRRYREGGAGSLRDRSSRPWHSPRRISETVALQAAELRRLRYHIDRLAAALKLSRASVSRILRRAGLHRLRFLDPTPPAVRYRHRRPGDLIHFDIQRLARIVKPGHRVHGDRTRNARGAGYQYLPIAIDNHSRLIAVLVLV